MDEESPSERQERWQRQQDEQDRADLRRRLKSYSERLKLYNTLWDRRVDFMDKSV